MMFNLLLSLSLISLTAAKKQATMSCGSGVSLCGVLALETGYGNGEYAAKEPAVHGLWPETDPYGDSECLAPSSTADPKSLASCYQNGTQDASDQLSFMQHEWEKHGTCAGVEDSTDFFSQVCDMADPPLAVMAKSKDAGGDLDAIANAVEAVGYEVFYVDTQYSQLYLSACATPERKWVLSKQANFAKDCGGW